MLLPSVGAPGHRTWTWSRRAVVALVGVLIVVYMLSTHHSASSIIKQIKEKAMAPRPSTHLDETPPPRRKAKYLSPTKLMERTLTRPRSAIPRLFHQSWSDRDLPKKFRTWSNRCREMHPDWEWVLWTDDDNAMLFERFMPWLSELFLNFPGPIYRADMARNAYMLLFGGVYADLDIDCLLPVEENLLSQYNISTIAHGEELEALDENMPNRTAFVGRMGTDEGFTNSIPNAWMASTAAHPFFYLILKGVQERLANGWQLPEDVTGPVALRDGLFEYAKEEYHPSQNGDDGSGDDIDKTLLNGPQDRNDTEQYADERARTLQHVSLHGQHEVVILPSYHIYPYSWERDGAFVRDVCHSAVDSFNETRCKELLAVDRWPSTTITYWSHSWNANGHHAGNLGKVSSKKRR